MVDNSAFYQRINQYLQVGDYSTALDTLKAFLTDNPTDEIGMSLLGTTYIRSERKDAA